MDDEQFLEQVFASIEEAEVLTIFFLRLRKSMVVDTRLGASGPYVEVMPQVGSVEERVEIIERTHPELGRVHNILSIPWIGEVESLREQGVIDRLIMRLNGTGMSRAAAIAACDRALAELHRAEHKSKIDIVKGNGFETIWQAQD